MKLKALPEFTEWLKGEREKDRAQVRDRLQRIQDHGYFGISKDLGEGLAELKWGNGRRVYYTVIRTPEETVVLLLGGNKNGQDKDIRKARKLLKTIEGG